MYVYYNKYLKYKNKYLLDKQNNLLYNQYDFLYNQKGGLNIIINLLLTTTIKFSRYLSKDLSNDDLFIFKQKYKNFKFIPKTCDKEYFLSILTKLDTYNLDSIQIKRTHPDKIKEIEKIPNICNGLHNSDKLCLPDNTFLENKTQIVLGRYYDNIGCYYMCNKYYIVLSIDDHTLLKNDLFIRYILSHPYNFGLNSIDFEEVFPIRLLISNLLIPEHKFMDLQIPDEYNLMKTTNQNEGQITSRELCELYYLNYYFYGILEDNISYKPYIMISPYDINSIIQKYRNKGRYAPRLKLLFTRNTI